MVCTVRHVVNGGFKVGLTLIPKVVRGWKQEENQRFGVCLVMQFVNDADGKVMFEYAPKLDEMDLWGTLFNAVREVDVAHKKAINVCSSLDSSFTVGPVEKNVCGGKAE